MKHDDIIHAVCASLEELGFADGEVESSTRLEEDLGIDSIETMELAAAVCKRLDVAWHTLDFRNVETVADFAERIQPLVEPEA